MPTPGATDPAPPGPTPPPDTRPPSPPSTVAVIGAGYVGLTTAVCLAHLGHQVVAVDVDAAKVGRMQRGEAPILEAGLPELLAEGLAAGRLTFTTDTAAASTDAVFVFLCVAPPQGADGSSE